MTDDATARPEDADHEYTLDEIVPLPAVCARCGREFVGPEAIMAPSLDCCQCFYCGGHGGRLVPHPDHPGVVDAATRRALRVRLNGPDARPDRLADAALDARRRAAASTRLFRVGVTTDRWEYAPVADGAKAPRAWVPLFAVLPGESLTSVRNQCKAALGPDPARALDADGRFAEPPRQGSLFD